MSTLDWQAAIKERLKSLDREHSALVVLVSAMVVSTGLVVWITRGRTYSLDEWGYIVQYGASWSPSLLITPANGHLIAAPLVLYKMVISTFGITSYIPVQLLSISLTLAVSGLLYAIARPRIGPTLALVPSLLILFFGAGWEVQLNASAISNQLCLAAGLGMLLALDRRDTGGDLGALALLAVSLASHTAGLAFAVGAATELGFQGRRSVARRWWIVVVPLTAYGAWFLWARKFHQVEPNASNFGSMVVGIADQLAAVWAAITGLFRTVGLPSGDAASQLLLIPLQWGIPLALGFVALVVLRMQMNPKPTARYWSVLAIAIAFFALITIGLSEGRLPNASRYVWQGSVLVLVVLIELAAGLTLSRKIKVVIWATLGLSLIGNIAQMHTAAQFFRSESDYNKAELGAIELLRGRVSPEFRVEEPSAGFVPHFDLNFSTAEYFAATDRYGSVADSEEELVARPEALREYADQLMARALGLSAAPTATIPPNLGTTAMKPLWVSEGRILRRGSCVVLEPRTRGQAASLSFELPTGGFSYVTQGDNQPSLNLGRFGSAASVPIATPAGSARLSIPEDRSMRPWGAVLTSSAALTACPA